MLHSSSNWFQMSLGTRSQVRQTFQLSASHAAASEVSRSRGTIESSRSERTSLTAAWSCVRLLKTRVQPLKAAILRNSNQLHPFPYLTKPVSIWMVLVMSNIILVAPHVITASEPPTQKTLHTLATGPDIMWPTTWLTKLQILKVRCSNLGLLRRRWA